MTALPDDVQRLYQQTILAHSRAPTHAHRPARFDASATGDNPMCGDRVEVFVRASEQNGIEQIGFEAQGCAISIASADLMAELLPTHSLADATDIAAAFARMIKQGAQDDPALPSLHPLAGVRDYPSRHRCATLPWQALLQALDRLRTSRQDAAA